MKIKCENMTCKYRTPINETCICDRIEIDEDGRCSSFARNLFWYTRKVFAEIEHGNFINALSLTTEMRIGLFFVTECWGLQYATASWGNCDMLTLHTCKRTVMKNDGNPIDPDRALNREDISHIEPNREKLEKWYRLVEMTDDEDLFDAVKTAASEDNDDETKTEQVRTPKKAAICAELGWLSPRGAFTPADFGDHDAAAATIIQAKGWDDDYRTWRALRMDATDVLYTHRDYLIERRRYVLIHDPSGSGAIATEPNTKTQREFLFDWFTAAGNNIRATQYLRD